MSKNGLYIFLISLSLAGYAWLAWNFVEGSGRASTPTLCVFKEVTGLPCPSCGTTRSLVLLMRGNFRESLQINPFGILFAIALLIIHLWIFVDLLRNTDSFYRRYVRAERVLAQNRWLSVSAIVVVSLNWFWNIAKGL